MKRAETNKFENKYGENQWNKELVFEKINKTDKPPGSQETQYPRWNTD